MIYKILTPIIFVVAQFLIAFWGNFSGQISSKNTFFTVPFDNAYLATLLLQFKYVWLLIIINFLFSMGFNFGFTGYKGFLTLMLLWIAAGPIAAFLFNFFFTKQSINIAIIIGAVLIFAGGVMVAANKEIMMLFK
ncbi:hypothetical protein ACFL6I_23120 [candidate division KSB1 bacterium]